MEDGGTKRKKTDYLYGEKRQIFLRVMNIKMAADVSRKK